MTWLINAQQVEKFRKSQKSLLILDASFHLPATHRNAKEEFEQKHVPGAQFFDIAAFFPIMHDPEAVSAKLSEHGIRNDYKIIFYDNSDIHSACRAVWMMKYFGHNPHQLYIMDGGLKAWEQEMTKIESVVTHLTPKKYKADFQPRFLRTLPQVKAMLQSITDQIVDLRHPARFAGGPETRPGIRSGHIPGSVSLPYSVLFEKNGYFLSSEKVRKLLDNLGISFNLPITATCGSGITACILDFLLDIAGHKNHGVYLGSWTEWGANQLYEDEVNLDERPVKTCLEWDCPPPIP